MMPSTQASIRSAEDLSGCVDCETQQIQVALTGSEEIVTLASDDGGAIVTLSVPAAYSQSALSSAIQVQSAQDRDPYASAESDLKSAVVDIVLVVDGQIVTDLSEPLEICLTFVDDPVGLDDLCLSYFDVDRQEWRCEDSSLTTNAAGQMCGTTPHLTSFALLLGGDIGSTGAYFPQETIAWISLGFIAGALVVIALGVGAIEIRYQRKRFADSRDFNRIHNHLQLYSSSSSS